MGNIAYSWFHDTDPIHICETFEPEGLQAGLVFDDLTETDLANIRQVLKKISARRIENPEDAEDVVQETLLTMIRKGAQTEIEKGMMIWAMGILRRKVGNYYRRTQRLVTQDEQVRYGFESHDIAPSPESSLHHAELLNMIRKLMANLAPEERAAVDLYLAGKQIREIVSLLQPERYQNILNRVHRGRRKLERELARYGYMKRALGKQRTRRARKGGSTVI
jgi:RNA polymerase sigma-70 factor (ECF subfamily)